MAALLLVLQSAALALLIARLLPGRRRHPPVPPRPEGLRDTTVSVVVATLNEARRIGPLLEGISRNGPPLIEVVVVDSRSSDGTADLVRAAAGRDPRIRLVTDPPLPAGWVGKVWALQHGLREVRGEWVLGLDADIEPHAGLVAGAVAAARALRYDVCSFSPRFEDQGAAEQWLQPAMLVTLVYRFGANGIEAPPPDRVMANGQCFLARREVLRAHGGYETARTSFADDVTLARHLAGRGVRVGFLDGSRLYGVRSYASAAEMWREWGRSFDLKDATTPARQWADVALVWLAQGLPLVVLAALAPALVQAARAGAAPPPAIAALAAVNASLLGMRIALLFALRGSYARTRWTFWLSWLADLPASVRLTMSSLRRPRAWRGRAYTPLGGAGERLV